MLEVKNSGVIGLKKLEGGVCGVGNVLFPDLVLVLWVNLVYKILLSCTLIIHAHLFLLQQFSKKYKTKQNQNKPTKMKLNILTF